MIELKNIILAYEKEKPVLKDVSFKVDKGGTLTIVGASGSGKSTLLRVIAGLLPSERTEFFSGHVSLNGSSSNQFMETGKLSFMFQEPSLFPNLTVKENIALPLRIKKISDPKKIDDLIHLVGLKDFEDYLPKSLSGGMKTRVALARSFVTDPEILLLDEPFSALDIGWKKILIEELIHIKKKLGTTLIMVTHDIQEAICLSNRFIILGRSGKIIDEHSLGNSHVKNNGYIDITRVPKYFPADLSRIQTILTLDSEKKEKSFNDIESILDLFLFYAGDDNHLGFYENMVPLVTDFLSEENKTNTMFLSKLKDIQNKATERQNRVLNGLFEIA